MTGDTAKAIGASVEEAVRQGRLAAGDRLPTVRALAEALEGVERVLQAHLGAGDRVAVEDPGYSGVLDLVAGTAHHTLCRNLRSPWAVVRSVSKSLSPDLRLAVVAGDAVTVARVEGRQAIGTGWVSHLLQGTVAALWADGSVTKLLAQAARTYSRRRQATIEALAEHGVKARGKSGLNVWVPVPEESAVIGGMLEAGWGLQAGERYRVSGPPAVRISTSRLHDGEAPAVAAALARCLQPTSRTRSV